MLYKMPCTLKPEHSLNKLPRAHECEMITEKQRENLSKTVMLPSQFTSTIYTILNFLCSNFELSLQR